ncbi:SIMPL domain-containing protein [Modestobacter sp. Leaf380]|uniref:SIMPL domain-containing protein n=1 Tax=Modestobacter sp. Leaf380 TaxID=1736356 RepID=UPI0006FA93C2|nr:SIMPL domain-containing protein [Modestobacter sp. Leaf380]KQS66024.1 hypothetical protein ASG41_11620 [Modestobacter sp. Leaf380]
MEPAPRVVVRGDVTHRVAPDHAELTLTVTGRDRQRDRALALVADHQRGVTDLLERFADLVTEHSTQGVSVHPVVEGRHRVTGHLASVSTRVRVAEVGRAGELAVAAAALGGCELWGPHWGLDPDSPAHAAARTAAIGEAVTRARGYAAAVGSTLTGLVELRDVGAGHGGLPVSATASRASGLPEAPEFDLTPALQDVHGAVEAVFTLTPPDLDAL